MARPGYNDDDSVNVSKGYTPRNTGNNNSGNQQSRNQTANELDRMINNSGNTGREQGIMQNASNNNFIPFQPSSNDYANKFGIYDINQPMATGFGSVFGASSGTTGSSDTVQDVLTYMMEAELDKGISPEKSAYNAYSNFYGGDIQMIDDDQGIAQLYGSLDMTNPSTTPDFLSTNRSVSEDWINRKYDQKMGGYGGGGGGGGGGGYGGGGDGGDGESYAGVQARSGMPQGNPNERFGSMAALQQNMINTNAGQNFQQGYARGGLVSLVR